MLDLKSLTSPDWADLADGVRLQLAPITLSRLRRAQDISGFPLIDAVEDAPEPSVSDTLRLCDAFADVFVLDWQGVGDENGDPLPFDREWLGRLLDMLEYQQPFLTLMMGRLNAWGAAKNGSGPAPAGNSRSARASATSTAGAATATPSRAAPARAGKPRRKT
jgi:hypothetical protein